MGSSGITTSVAGIPRSGTSPKLKATSGSEPATAPSDTKNPAAAHLTALIPALRTVSVPGGPGSRPTRASRAAGTPMSNTPAIDVKLSWNERSHSALGSIARISSAANPTALIGADARPVASASRYAEPMTPARTADGGAPASAT